MASAGTPICSTIRSIVTAPGVSTSVSGCEISVGHRFGCAWRGGLGVGEVVAVLAADEEIFADVRQRHELVVDAAADRAGIRLDDHVVQAEAVEHALVRLVHHAVGLAHPLLVTVERVRVLHQELASAQQSVPRPELVAVLPLHLVDVHRQVAVRGELLLHERSRDLLLRRTEDELPVRDDPAAGTSGPRRPPIDP